jgi:hypothetical protein
MKDLPALHLWQALYYSSCHGSAPWRVAEEWHAWPCGWEGNNDDKDNVPQLQDMQRVD